MQWRYDLSRPGKEPDRPDPFADAKDARRPPRAANSSGDASTDFQLVKGRVFCLRGRRELIALDGDTGALDWSFSSPPGEINPNIWIGADRAVLQVEQAQPVARPADRRRPAGHRGPRWPRTSCSSGRRCPSTTTRSCWCPTAGPSRSST